MSKAVFMIDCVSCAVQEGVGRKLTPTGRLIREMRTLFRGGPIFYKDLCDKCGGSGRIAASTFNKVDGNVTRKFSKRHKLEMKMWIAQQKQILYGTVN